PRWPGATGGAVGSAGGAGPSSRSGRSTVSCRGPTDSGGAGVGGATGGAGVAIGGGGTGEGMGAVVGLAALGLDGAAHPKTTEPARTSAVARLATSRLWGIVLRTRNETAQHVRRNRPTGRRLVGKHAWLRSARLRRLRRRSLHSRLTRSARRRR